LLQSVTKDCFSPNGTGLVAGGVWTIRIAGPPRLVNVG
jgi:hypothetical protein